MRSIHEDITEAPRGPFRRRRRLCIPLDCFGRLLFPADPCKHGVPEVSLIVPSGFVSLNTWKAVLVENCTYVLKLVLDGSTRARWEQLLEAPVQLGLYARLAAHLGGKQVEV